MPELSPDQFWRQEWHHGGYDPRSWESGPGTASVIHLGTHAAASQRIDPSTWDHEDAEASGAHVGASRLWGVKLKPGTRIHPQLHTDDEAGSPGFSPPKGYHGVAYHNEFEDEGSVSLAVQPSRIASVRREPDPHRRARAEWIMKTRGAR